MFSKLSLTAAVLGAKWLEDGLIANSDGTLSKAYHCLPMELGLFEEALEGQNAESFYSKVGDLLSRLPDRTNGQIIFTRQRERSGALRSQIFLFETVATAKSFSHLESLLLELGLDPSPLRAREWRKLIGEFFGTLPEEALPDLVWEDGQVLQGEKVVKAVSLTELPQLTWKGCFQSIFDKGDEFLFSLRLKVPSREKSRRQLETKRRISHALSIASSFDLQNIESNSVLTSAEETLERILVGKETLLEMSAAVIFSASSDKTADLARDFVGLAAGVGNAGMFPEGVGVLPVFKSHIPGNRPLAIRSLPVLSGNLSHLLPLTLDYSRAHEPSPLKLLARSGEQSHLNLFSKANLNFNATICGASGSGKSFLMNSKIQALLKEVPNARLCIFDVGGSYRKLIAAEGGLSKALSPAEANLLLASYFRRERVQNNGFFRALIEVLCGTGAHVTHSHRVAIGELLQGVQGEELRLGGLVKAASLRREPFFQDLAHWLKPFIQLDSLASSPELMDLSRSRIAAFDFKNLSNDPVLERTTVLVLSALIWEDLKKGVHPRTLVVFDEVWRFFKGVKDYIEEMYRTFRKYSAGIVSITQNAADYGDDEFSKMIFSNTFTKIFLENGATRELLSSSLDLTLSDVERALSVASKKPHYSEFFVKSGAMSQILRLYPEQEFYALANTENINS
jgi:hypothetical protein